MNKIFKILKTNKNTWACFLLLCFASIADLRGQNALFNAKHIVKYSGTKEDSVWLDGFLHQIILNNKDRINKSPKTNLIPEIVNSFLVENKLVSVNTKFTHDVKKLLNLPKVIESDIKSLVDLRVYHLSGLKALKKDWSADDFNINNIKSFLTLKSSISKDSNYKTNINLDSVKFLLSEKEKIQALRYGSILKVYNMLSADSIQLINLKLKKTADSLKLTLRGGDFGKSAVLLEGVAFNSFNREFEKESKFIAQNLSSFKIPTSESEAIDAISIFMVNRFKQEISLSFFENMKRLTDTIPLLGGLFPKTIELLMQQNGYELPKLGSNWEYAFAEDIKSLPINLKKLDWSKAKWLSIDSQDLQAFQLSVDLLEGIASRKNFVDAISLMCDANPYHSENKSSVLKYAHILNVFNKELFSIDTVNKRYYVSYDEFKNLSQLEFSTFLKLVYGSHKVVLASICDTSKLKEIVLNEKDTQFRNALGAMIVDLNQFEYQQNELSKKIKAGGNYYGLTPIWMYQYQLFKDGIEIVKLIDVKDKIVISKYEKHLEVFRHFVEIYKAYEVQNYGLMVTNALMLVSENSMARIKQFDAKTIKYIRSTDVWNYMWEGKLSKQIADIKISDAIYKNSKRVSERFLYKQKMKFLETKFVSLSDEDANAILEKFNFSYPNKSQITLSEMRKFCSTKADRNRFFEMGCDFSDSLITNLIVHRKRFQSKSVALDLFKARKLLECDKLLVETLQKSDSALNAYAIFQKEKYLGMLSNYSSFIIDVLKAGSSKELTETVLSYAAPASSYNIKRNTRSGLSLNGFVGAYAAIEWPNGKSVFKESYFASGFTVPIGLTYSRGIRLKNKSHISSKTPQFMNRRGNMKYLSTGGSKSITFTAFDFVAPFVYRFTSNDSAPGLPKEIKFEQLFSPGVLLHRSIGKSGFNWTFGCQVNPSLRAIKKIDQTLVFQNTFKFYFGIVFDIPFYNIYHRKP